jgi:diguanylate cyclase (GGDEF)-like protein
MESLRASRWERLVEAILDLSALINVGPRREEIILERVLRTCAELLAARFVHLLLLKEDGIRRFVLKGEESGREVLSVQTLPKSRNLVQWIQQENAAGLHRRDLERSRHPLGNLASPPAVLLSAPLNARARQLGVLMVFAKDQMYGGEDAKMLALLANQAAVALENADLYHKLEAEASTDGLTGAYNYRYFMEALGREIKRGHRFGEPLAVCMIDVDNLKEYNDLHGHLAGSAALKDLAELLRRSARDSDLVAKYGGDEFSVVLPNTGLAGALAFAERVLRRVEHHHFEGDATNRLTVSMGIALYPQDGQDPRALLMASDRRLYRAKFEGKNQVSTVGLVDTTAPAQEDQR